jgi:hypothetical protein
MNSQTFMTISGGSVVVGLAAVVAPAQLAAVFGVRLGLVVSAVGIVAGLAGGQSWLLVVLEVPLAAAWGYFAFIDRSEVVPT